MRLPARLPLLGTLLLTLAALTARAQTQPVVAAPDAPGATIIVNSTADLPDAAEDGVCAAANGACTLRAAVSTANLLSSNDTIVLPVGIYTIARVGQDDTNVAGDFDINIFGSSGTLTIAGGGRDNTVIDGGGAPLAGRIFHVFNAALSLRDLTLRNGREAGAGGAVLANNPAPPGFTPLPPNPTKVFLPNIYKP